MVYEVLIIGGGPAGLTAALYAGRSRLKSVLIEKLTLGGQLLFTEEIENFPGVYKMNSGAWIEMSRKQLLDLEDVEIREETQVEKIENKNGIFKISICSNTDNEGVTLESKSLIVATGAQPKKLGIPGEEAFTGRGVSYCGTCDGPLFKDKDILVIGAGNTAIEEALYLRRFAKKVTVVHRRDELRAAALLRERAKRDEKINFRLSVIPVEMVGKMRLEGLKVRDLKTGKEEVILASGIFVFIGSSPETSFLEDSVDLSEDGYIVTDENMMSSLPGLFACGDCRQKSLSQVVTACSDGAIAANSALKFLEDKI